jgi:hypothetical protein
VCFLSSPGDCRVQLAMAVLPLVLQETQKQNHPQAHVTNWNTSALHSELCAESRKIPPKFPAPGLHGNGISPWISRWACVF